jgi:hypothetical protein
LELIEIYQILIHVDDFNILGENINTIKKNTEALSDGRKDPGLDVNAEKTEAYIYILS